jgi:hypothetical protein
VVRDANGIPITHVTTKKFVDNKRKSHKSTKDYDSEMMSSKSSECRISEVPNSQS